MRYAIVTGASRGIGRAVTDALLADDWDVLGVSRSDPGVEHARFRWCEWDVSLPWLAFAGQFDALVHAAGIRGPYGPLEEADEDEWVRTITTNLIGAYRIVRAALPALRRSDDGRILLFSGGGAFSPEPGYSAYAASKGGTISLMETLAEELGGTRVTVNAVAPGFVATGIHGGTPHEGRSDAPDAMSNVVACVRHLLSPAARGLTGKTISAQWDDFRSIDQTNVDAVNASEMGTRHRHKIQCVRDLVRPKRLAAV